jgi:hypothetical protein
MGLALNFDTHVPIGMDCDGIDLLSSHHARNWMLGGNFLDFAADSANLFAEILEFLGTTWKD